MTIKSIIFGALLAFASLTAAQTKDETYKSIAKDLAALTLPTNSAEIYAVWVIGEMYETEAREKLRTYLTPTPQVGEDQYIGLQLGACKAPDGGEYGVGWPVYTEEEKAMWNKVIQAKTPAAAASQLQFLIHGVQLLWEEAGLSEEAKHNWLTKISLIARDCFPPPMGA